MQAVILSKLNDLTQRFMQQIQTKYTTSTVRNFDFSNPTTFLSFVLEDLMPLIATADTNSHAKTQDYVAVIAKVLPYISDALVQQNYVTAQQTTAIASIVNELDAHEVMIFDTVNDFLPFTYFTFV